MELKENCGAQEHWFYYPATDHYLFIMWAYKEEVQKPGGSNNQNGDKQHVDYELLLNKILKMNCDVIKWQILGFLEVGCPTTAQFFVISHKISSFLHLAPTDLEQQKQKETCIMYANQPFFSLL